MTTAFPRQHEFGGALHSERCALRTAFVAAVVTVSLLVPLAWLLQAIGALR